MKTQVIRNLSVALIAAASAFAQAPQKINAQIPFEFHVGKSILPAGEYAVYTDTPNVLRLRSSDSKSAAIILTRPTQKLDGPAEGKLIFNKYGDEYFLSQVWRPGINTGSELQKTRREFEAEASARRNTESVMARR